MAALLFRGIRGQSIVLRRIFAIGTRFPTTPCFFVAGFQASSPSTCVEQGRMVPRKEQRPTNVQQFAGPRAEKDRRFVGNH